jgi:hypothetical protein
MQRGEARAIAAAVVGAVCLLATPFPTRAQLCNVYDASCTIDSGSCGTYTWELVAQGPDGTHDEGSYTIFGYCGGGYYNCSCSYVQQYTREGSKSFRTLDEGGGQVDFWWDVTNWNEPTYSGCTGSQCGGEIENTSTYTDMYVGYDSAFCYN